MQLIATYSKITLHMGIILSKQVCHTCKRNTLHQ